MEKLEFKYNGKIVLNGNKTEEEKQERDFKTNKTIIRTTKKLSLSNPKGRHILTISDASIKSKNEQVLSQSETTIKCYEKYFMTVQKKTRCYDIKKISYYIYSAYSYSGKMIGDSICKFHQDNLDLLEKELISSDEQTLDLEQEME
ncbi:MAG: hypothetical protein E7379_03955 [Clostridiales bacterium]|nr:hypothetical protein [Clostridiales bacterium]